MSAVTLGSADGGLLLLSDPRRGDDGELLSITATVHTQGLRASTRVDAHYSKCFDDLVAFLDDLVAYWRGWSGSKSYQSLERDLELVARHDGVGHVVLAVTLRGPDSPYSWTASGEVITDPGEQMREAAADARSLLARAP